MTEFIISIVAAICGAVLIKSLDWLRKWDAEKEAKQIIERAELQAASRHKDAEVEAKAMALAEKARIEEQLAKVRRELDDRERQLNKTDDRLTQRAEQLSKQERMVEANQRKVAEQLEDARRRNEELTDLLDVQRQTLHKLSGLGQEEAKSRLLEKLDAELAQEQGGIIMRFQRQLAETCDTKAKEMLLTSVQRFAAAHTAEATTSTVDIPSDEMKGRIIGREGRNIRAFEKQTGVDVIIDDTPGVVIVSAFDPVRRETARVALSKLIADGRIHPSRIEELVAETEKEIEAAIQRYGEEAVQEADVHGLHERVVNLLGRLRFRTSYSQNVLRHSI
jgi:ribonuclease Y